MYSDPLGTMLTAVVIASLEINMKGTKLSDTDCNAYYIFIQTCVTAFSSCP